MRAFIENHPFTRTRTALAVAAMVVTTTAGAAIVAASSGDPDGQPGTPPEQRTEAAGLAPPDEQSDAPTPNASNTNSDDRSPRDTTEPLPTGADAEEPTPTGSDPTAPRDASSDDVRTTSDANTPSASPADPDETPDALDPDSKNPSEIDPPADDPGPIDGVTPPQIEQHGASTEKPTSPEPTPPSWDSIDLDLLDTPGDIEARNGPAPVKVPPVVPEPPFPPDPGGNPGAGGGLVGNATGCQLSCITSAQLHQAQFESAMTFELETTVPVTAFVWVSSNQPVIDGGYPVMNTWPDHANPHRSQTWETHINGLQFASTYHLTLLVVDEDGHERWAMTSFELEGVGGLAGNGSGCYYQCIEHGSIIGTPGHDTADFVVSTSVDADIDVVVSTSAPVIVGGTPTLGADRPVAIDVQNSTTIRGTATALAADTTYHVLASATDADGFTAHATGTFHTDHAPHQVLITFAHIDVIGDGDPGNVDRGEIAFEWGLLDGSYRGGRSEEKIASDTRVYLPDGSGRWVTVPHDGLLPSLAVNAIEHDWQDYVAHDPYRCNQRGAEPLRTRIDIDTDCNTHLSAATLSPQPVTWIDSLPSCAVFGYTDFRKHHRCARIESPPLTDEFVTFAAVVTFDVS
ncbi:MAG: hypothetical protein AB8G26_11050 [Ilumatobacter sp.]